jgi:hypothetical protein
MYVSPSALSEIVVRLSRSPRFIEQGFIIATASTAEALFGATATND